MMFNKKELTALFVLSGAGLFGWGIGLYQDKFSSLPEKVWAAVDSGCQRSAVASLYDEKKYSKSENTSLICINTADEKELQKIKGIGPSLAMRIVAYRKEQGNFKSIDDLISVKGIGTKKLDSIRKSVVLEDKKP